MLAPRTFALALMVTLGLSSIAVADDGKPAPQLQAIRRLIGSWSGKGTLVSDGKTHSIGMTYTCVESAGAAGVRCQAEITGIPNFRYVFDDLWGYSAADGLVHWYAVTNAGEVHDHRGHFDAAGGQLAAELATEGKIFTEVITFKRKNKTMSMSWVTTLGGTVKERGKIDLTIK